MQRAIVISRALFDQEANKESNKNICDEVIHRWKTQETADGFSFRIKEKRWENQEEKLRMKSIRFECVLCDSPVNVPNVPGALMRNVVRKGTNCPVAMTIDFTNHIIGETEVTFFANGKEGVTEHNHAPDKAAAEKKWKNVLREGECAEVKNKVTSMYADGIAQAQIAATISREYPSVPYEAVKYMVRAAPTDTQASDVYGILKEKGEKEGWFVKFDLQNLILNAFFFATPQMQKQAARFCDAVEVDATYLKLITGQNIVSFVGRNENLETTLLFVGVITKEGNAEWAKIFYAFREYLDELPEPKAFSRFIISDGDVAIHNGIDAAFADRPVVRMLCRWHKRQNIEKQMTSTIAAFTGDHPYNVLLRTTVEGEFSFEGLEMPKGDDLDEDGRSKLCGMALYKKWYYAFLGSVNEKQANGIAKAWLGEMVRYAKSQDLPEDAKCIQYTRDNVIAHMRNLCVFARKKVLNLGISATVGVESTNARFAQQSEMRKISLSDFPALIEKSGVKSISTQMDNVISRANRVINNPYQRGTLAEEGFSAEYLDMLESELSVVCVSLMSGQMRQSLRYHVQENKVDGSEFVKGKPELDPIERNKAQDDPVFRDILEDTLPRKFDTNGPLENVDKRFTTVSVVSRSSYDVIIFKDRSVICSCFHYAETGIPCRHMFSLHRMKKIVLEPLLYVHERYHTKDFAPSLYNTAMSHYDEFDSTPVFLPINNKPLALERDISADALPTGPKPGTQPWFDTKRSEAVKLMDRFKAVARGAVVEQEGVEAMRKVVDELQNALKKAETTLLPQPKEGQISVFAPKRGDKVANRKGKNMKSFTSPASRPHLKPYNKATQPANKKRKIAAAAEPKKKKKTPVLSPGATRVSSRVGKGENKRYDD